jgi:hypothetical protein
VHQPVYQGAAVSDSQPASVEGFTMFANIALESAMNERFARWGRDFIDPNSMKEPTDNNGNSLGVRIFEAYRCHFNLMRQSNVMSKVARLTLTVDLKAKVIRTASLFDNIWGNADPKSEVPMKEQGYANREWVGETVITTHDRKCYSVIELLFKESANSLKIPDKKISHAQYFESKGHKLKYPDAKLMVAVQGRRKMTIYFPAEMVAGNELDSRIKERLPSIASFTPDERKAAIDKVSKYLTPGAQKTKDAGGLLPALGIQLGNGSRINATARVLPIPAIIAAGVTIPGHKGENWAPLLTKASYTVDPKSATVLNIVLVCHNQLIRSSSKVYNRIRDMVNKYGGKYRMGEKPFVTVEAGTIFLMCRSVHREFFVNNDSNSSVVVQAIFSTITVLWKNTSQEKSPRMSLCWTLRSRRVP